MYNLYIKKIYDNTCKNTVFVVKLVRLEELVMSREPNGSSPGGGGGCESPGLNNGTSGHRSADHELSYKGEKLKLKCPSRKRTGPVKRKCRGGSRERRRSKLCFSASSQVRVRNSRRPTGRVGEKPLQLSDAQTSSQRSAAASKKKKKVTASMSLMEEKKKNPDGWMKCGRTSNSRCL